MVGTKTVGLCVESLICVGLVGFGRFYQLLFDLLVLRLLILYLVIRARSNHFLLFVALVKSVESQHWL